MAWERKGYRCVVSAREAVVDIYNYDSFWACGHAGVQCVLPSAPAHRPRPVHTYAHYESIPRAPNATNLGSAMGRERGGQPGVVDAIRFRQPTQGPELRMVDSFLKQGLPKPKPGERLSVMVEPKVESAFPDIVAAYWDPLVAEKWPFARRALTKADLRLVHFLHSEGGSASVDGLFRCFSGRAAKRSIERLQSAAVIDVLPDQIRLRPLEEIFALRRLLCLEAKISSPARALDQAVRCTWFASEVYLLVDSAPTDEELFRIARLHGIGVTLPGCSVKDAVVAAVPGRLPRSYATWMFNEWVWRLADDPVTGREYPARY